MMRSAHLITRLKFPLSSGAIRAACPANTFPLLPSTVIHSPSPTLRPLTESRSALLIRPSRLLGSGHTGLAHAAGHHRRVGGHSAASGEYRLGGDHPVEVLG